MSETEPPGGAEEPGGGTQAPILRLVEAVIILVSFGIATGVIGRAKGSSFFIWLIVGTALPLLGLIAVILFRREKAEPERRCPRCGAVHKLYVQVCHRCGEDMYLPDPSEVRPGPDYRRPGEA